MKFGRKRLILMRGLPGSGKSSLIKDLFKTDDLVVASAAQYFCRSGEYVFKREDLRYAHNYARSVAVEAMKNRVSTVVVDNTNIQSWEIRPYVEAADEFGYEVVHIVFEPYADVDFAERNTHGVPAEKIREMRKRWDIVL